MQVQAGIDQPCRHAAHEGDTFLGSDSLQNLLEEVVSEWINHGLGPEGETFIQDGCGGAGSIFIEGLLQQTTTNLIAGKAADIAQQGSEGRTLWAGVEHGEGPSTSSITAIVIETLLHLLLILKVALIIISTKAKVVHSILGLVTVHGVISPLLLLLLLHGVAILRILIVATLILLAIHVIIHPIVHIPLLYRLHQHHWLTLWISSHAHLIAIDSIVICGGSCHRHHERAGLSGHLHHLHRLEDLSLAVRGGDGHVEHLRLLLLRGHGHWNILLLLHLLWLLLDLLDLLNLLDLRLDLDLLRLNTGVARGRKLIYRGLLQLCMQLAGRELVRKLRLLRVRRVHSPRSSAVVRGVSIAAGHGGAHAGTYGLGRFRPARRGRGR
mmetsp:Transcript_45460/g.95418  ORF Transcript_45460/g.95418 Transcript_45460/m.95418 type:complete len:382 (-) Transcript_45460:1042-2187(-)